MQIGNRLFPYPVVNNNKELSDFNKSACYELSFGNPDLPIKEERYELVIEDVYINLVDSSLISYVKRGLLQAVLVIECPESIFRKTYELSLDKTTIRVPLSDLNGKVTVSSYLYATEDILDYKSDNFNEDFKLIEFELNKYDIVGVDDGFSFKIEHNDLADNVAESIFEILRGQTNQKYLQYEANCK